MRARQPALSAWVAELAHISLAHVRTLRAQLGANAEKMPLVNIGDAWQAAASAALNVTALEPVFSPYANDVFFLHASYLIEDVSVSSLRGVSWMVQDNVPKSLIAGLLGSAGVDEVRRLGLWRNLEPFTLGLVDVRPIAYFLSVAFAGLGLSTIIVERR